MTLLEIEPIKGTSWWTNPSLCIIFSLKSHLFSAKMKLIVVLALLSLACAKELPKYEFVEEWQLWKSRHSRHYESEREELERHLVWVSNREYINQHNANADLFGFTLALNHFGDMNDAEFMDKYGTYVKSSKKHSREFKVPEGTSFPSSMDWRTKGAVTAVKNQGDCGSSYAFSAIGALEGASALAHGKQKSLSEQNIIDCSVSYGNHGCQGGNMYNSYMYILSNEGVDTLDSYPFYGRQGACKYSKTYRGAQISGSVSISSGNEGQLLAAVASTGPVAVAVDGSNKAFRYYSSGVYNLPGCSSYSLSHALLIIGYGTTNDVDYWLLKNSWGTNWGMSGYVMMSRNRYNQCGIATDASYPTL